MGDQDWFVRLGGDATTAAQVFGFPHAGAGCAQLAGLARQVGPVAAFWSANLPGRQARLHEPPARDLDQLAEALADQLTRRPLARMVLFGYCAGGLLALLVGRALRDLATEPAALVVASCEAPDIARWPRDLPRLPSRRLWERLAPASTDPDPLLRQVAEPAVRADFAMLAGYRHQARPPLSCPVTVCFGATDPTPRGAWLGWRRQSTGRLRLRALPGGPRPLDAAPADLARVLTGVVTEDLPADLPGDLVEGDRG